MTITIDEEFQSLIPPLSDLERLQLEETLEKEGCRDPLITWKGILIDGHNRHEICERLGLEYTTREIVLVDRDSVKQWMYRNQLGRRNLSPADASELRGLMYNARKKTKGGDRKSKVQNDPLIESTAEVVAKETGVSPATIKRDGEYAEAVAEVAKIEPAIRQQVRNGTAKKKDVIAASKVAKSSPEKAREIVTSGKAKKPAKAKAKKSQPVAPAESPPEFDLEEATDRLTKAIDDELFNWPGSAIQDGSEGVQWLWRQIELCLTSWTRPPETSWPRIAASAANAESPADGNPQSSLTDN